MNEYSVNGKEIDTFSKVGTSNSYHRICEVIVVDKCIYVPKLNMLTQK